MIFDYPLQISQITKIKCVVTWQQYWVSRNPIRGLRIFESKNRPFHRRFDFFLHHPIHVTKFSHFRNLKWNVKDKDSLNVVSSFFPNFIAFHLFIIYYYYFLIVSKPPQRTGSTLKTKPYPNQNLTAGRPPGAATIFAGINSYLVYVALIAAPIAFH